VVGAGPAGATAALNLAPTRSVLLTDWRDLRSDSPSVGESLAPAARRLFDDMGILDSFLTEDHLPWYGNRSVWGAHTVAEGDLLRDLDGHGWHLDRANFDNWLRATAMNRGTTLLPKAQLQAVEPLTTGRGWLVSLSTGTRGRVQFCARVLIDASGRFASLARRLGARQQSLEERLVCAWVNGLAPRETSGTAGFTLLEAVEDGWWYSAPLPQGRRTLAFHTDPGLTATALARSTESLVLHAARATVLASLLDECKFSANSGRVRLTVANGGRLSPPAGPGWFSAGDAAVHFDPLSSQGLLNALFTGLATAEASDRLLEGEEPKPVAESYKSMIANIWKLYLSHRQAWYHEENRWPEAPFWSRRHRSGTP